MPAILPTAEQLAAGNATVTCLVCLQHAALGTNIRCESTRFVADHRVDSAMTVACRGSGYVPVQNDGRDEVRRHALNQRRVLLIEIAELRVKVNEALTVRGWSFASVHDMYGVGLTSLETQASLWRLLAEHGDQWKALTDVLTLLCRESVNSATAEGYRQWLFSVKGRLADVARETGENVLATLLDTI
jgi:hypothetical protein